MAYSKPDESGDISVSDSTVSSEAGLWAQGLFKPGAGAIICIPRDSPSFPSPYRKALGMSKDQYAMPVFGIIPITVRKERVEKLIDLRIPEVQAWFTRELTNMQDSITGRPWFPLAGPLTDFAKLLPSLLSVSRGDSRRVTQAAGLWLRRIGTEALVFPSARSNVFTRFSEGNLEDFGGWNMVDYRNSADPYIAGFMDLSPEWDEFPMSGGDILSGNGGSPIIFRSVRITVDATKQGSGSLCSRPGGRSRSLSRSLCWALSH